MGLKIEKVSKYYGEKLAVDNISFEMNEPGVFGLLGTNGAGKTTTIRMILGIIKKNAGEITWNGQKVERKNVNFGYLPEETGIYPKTKIIEQLMYFAELKGMKKQEAAKEIDYWLKRLKVEEYKELQAEKLSKGNQQKIQFITAILNNPELIVLDEPTNALDEKGIKEFHEIALEAKNDGATIIIASHSKEDIDILCDKIFCMENGKITKEFEK